MPYIGNPIYQSAFVTDQFSGDGTTTAFTMSVAPAGTTNVLVVVSGVVQDPSTYGVVGTTLNFSAAPPSGTGNISCRYLGVPVTGVTTTAYRTVTEFTATASQTTFTPPSYNVGFINVYLNGVLLGSADYTATNGTTVVLATGASAGNILTVESFRIESVANAISNSAGSVGTTNIADGAVTPAKLSTGGPYWTSGGYLGIGTTSPSQYLSVVNPSATSGVIAGFGTNAAQNLLTVSYDIPTGASTFQGSPYGLTALSSNGAYPVTLNTNSLERMRIDSSGYVTTPYQAAFNAAMSTGAVISSGNVVVYDNAYTNIGSCYSTSTGRFTAPVSGMYQFNFNIYSNAATFGSARFSVNGGTNAASGPLFQNVGNSNYPTTAASQAIYLNAGDTMAVYINSGSMYADQDCRFSGFLIG